MSREKYSTVDERLAWVRKRAHKVRDLDANALFKLMKACGLFAPSTYWGDCFKTLEFLLREVKRKTV